VISFFVATAKKLAAEKGSRGDKAEQAYRRGDAL
jgi:hypothetical protein